MIVPTARGLPPASSRLCSSKPVQTLPNPPGASPVPIPGNSSPDGAHRHTFQRAEEAPARNTLLPHARPPREPASHGKKRAGPRNSGSGSESTAACAAPCHIISIRSAPQQVFLRGPQPSNRPERAPRRASRRAPPPRTPAPRWGRCRGCRAGRMPDRKESRA